MQQTKNTVAMLNELRQGLVYHLEAQSGPVHAPIFTMTVEVILYLLDYKFDLKTMSTFLCPSHFVKIKWITQVDGEKYAGQGRSKKLARIQAAEAALRNFIQFKDGTAMSPIKAATTMDFTSDDHMDTGNGNIGI